MIGPVSPTEYINAASAFFAAVAAVAAWRANRASHIAERPQVYLAKTLKTLSRDGLVERVDGVNFRNTGRTSAHVRFLVVRFCFSERPPDPRSLTLEPYPPTSAIIAGEVWPSEKTPVELGVTRVDFEKQAGSNRRLFCFGRMIYEDGFGAVYDLRFCRLFNAGSFAYDPDQTPELELHCYNGTRRVRWWQRRLRARPRQSFGKWRDNWPIIQ